MDKRKTMAEEASDILARLRELAKLDFPQYRSYRAANGEWIEREPVPEYLEQQELIRRWHELHAFEQYFSRRHNLLLVGLSLHIIANDLNQPPRPLDEMLQYRIAVSVYENVGVCL